MVIKMRYITNKQGERVGVLLDLETFDRLFNPSNDTDTLTGLSQSELQALAESKLAPASQSQLTELLDRNTDNQLNEDELAELDRLLAQSDHLTMLKTRSRYKLRSFLNPHYLNLPQR
jgi:hypothetical protein